MLLMELAIMREIEQRLSEVLERPEKITAHAGRLDALATGEKVIAVLESKLLRGLFVVMVESFACSKVEMAQVQLAMNEIDAEEHRHRGYCLDELNDVVNELFWAEVKREINFKRTNDSTIGMREGWKVVTSENNTSGMPASLRALIGGFGPV